MIIPQMCEVPAITITWIDPQGIDRPLYGQVDSMTNKERFERDGTFIAPKGVHQVFVQIQQ